MATTVKTSNGATIIKLRDGDIKAPHLTREQALAITTKYPVGTQNRTKLIREAVKATTPRRTMRRPS